MPTSTDASPVTSDVPRARRLAPGDDSTRSWETPDPAALARWQRRARVWRSRTAAAAWVLAGAMPRGRQARLACATCLGALAVVSAAGPAQVRAENGALAYAAKHAGKPVVYMRAPDGGGLRVIPARGWADAPAVSPGGRRLAFRRTGRLGSQIWVTYLDGSGLRQLTSGPADGAPDWSPAADVVVFASGPAGRRDLYTVGADGARQRRLTHSAADDHSPSWSTRGQIAFVRRSPGGDRIYAIGAQGGRARLLTNGPTQDRSPAWSPSGPLTFCGSADAPQFGRPENACKRASSRSSRSG
jgi:dipeptidyl aminopeptidase/acylaminoacyl peptidase